MDGSYNSTHTHTHTHIHTHTTQIQLIHTKAEKEYFNMYIKRIKKITVQYEGNYQNNDRSLLASTCVHSFEGFPTISALSKVKSSKLYTCECMCVCCVIVCVTGVCVIELSCVSLVRIFLVCIE